MPALSWHPGMVSVDGQSGNQGIVTPRPDRTAAVRSALRAAARQLAEEERQRDSGDQRAAEAPRPPIAPPDSRVSHDPLGDPSAEKAPPSRLDRLLGITRDRRDRWLVLKSLEGQRVTVLAGFKYLVSHTGTLVIFNDRSDGQLRSDPPSVVIDDGKRQRWFPIDDVHSVTDPSDGSALGGPW